MMGMDENTGQMLTGEVYVRQAIRRLLKLLKRTMVMHREKGTDLQPLLAQPTTDVWMLTLTGEVISSIETMLRGVKVLKVGAEAQEGNFTTSVQVQWKESVFSVSSEV